MIIWSRHWGVPYFVKEPNLQDFNWIYSRPAEVETYITDPLCGFTFTNNGFYSLMTIMQQGTKKTWYNTVSNALLLLFLSGADDPVGQMGKGVPRIITDLKAPQFVDVQAKIYPAMRHEILNEKDHIRVYSDILDWLDSVIDNAVQNIQGLPIAVLAIYIAILLSTSTQTAKK